MGFWVKLWWEETKWPSSNILKGKVSSSTSEKSGKVCGQLTIAPKNSLGQKTHLHFLR